MSWENKKVKCPYCGESYYMENNSVTTAMYYPPIYKDGVNVNPDGNYTTTECICMNCHHRFSYKMRFGEILEYTDYGETKETPITLMM